LLIVLLICRRGIGRVRLTSSQRRLVRIAFRCRKVYQSASAVANRRQLCANSSRCSAHDSSALDGTSGQLDQHPLNTLSYCFSEKYPTQPFLYPRHVFLSLHNLTPPHRSLASSPQINAPWVFNALWYFIKVRRAEQNRVMLVACPIEHHAPYLSY
jgi:hypothetical protein